LSLKVFEPVLLLPLVVLIVDDVLEHRLNLLDAAEKRHVVPLSGSLLILLFTNVELSFLLDCAIDHVGL
jgi:hypothetical protein